VGFRFQKKNIAVEQPRVDPQSDPQCTLKNKCLIGTPYFIC
jgi:hypothetical protein